ncbi:MAG: peptidoglycan-binding protein [Acidimicrobiia bacterium]
MPLYRKGDSGDPVRDIQERLRVLGFPTNPDPTAHFGEPTRRAVVAFQRSRNLIPDGLVGRETWNSLVEAGYRLGHRLLYYRLPMLRGDDVAELQQTLNALGFDVGKVDGIFGPGTLRALLDFQQNRRMAEDGIVGPDVLSELSLMVRATKKAGRQSVRERQWLRSLPHTAAGQRILLDPFCRDNHEAPLAWDAASAAATALRDHGAHPILSRSIDTYPPERLRAQRANRLGVDIVVAFALPATDVPGVFFFASTHSRSEAGELLAKEIAGRLEVAPAGRSMPILKETRAPAIVVCVSTLDSRVGRVVGGGLQSWFEAAAQPTSGA